MSDAVVDAEAPREKKAARDSASVETTTCGGGEAAEAGVRFAIWAVLGGVVVAFVALFTGMGVGVWYVIRTRRLEWVGSVFGLSAACLAVAMGLLDAAEWERAWVRNLVAAVAGACAVVYVLLRVDHYAYGPLCFFVLGVPVALVAAGAASGASLDARLEAFGDATFVPLAACSAVLGAAWLAWVAGVPGITRSGNSWPSARDNYGERLNANGVRCRETNEENWMDDEEVRALTPYGECLEVAMIWSSPFIYALALLVFAFVARLVGRTEKVAKKVGVLVAVLLAGCWCAASLAGAAHGVSTALFAAALAGALGLVFVAAHFSHGVRGLVASLGKEDSTAYDKFVKPYEDVWKGGLVLVAWPPFLGYLAFSFLRRGVRGCRGRTRDGEVLLTHEASRLVDRITDWNWTAVLRFAALWGFGVVALTVVVSKFTVLLMSIVVSVAADSSIAVATAIIVLVGLGLFLLPPVPGAPIYLAAGVLLTANGKANGVPVVFAILFALAVSLATKLVACALQQKLIGANLAGNLAVRRLCNVNSDVVRTMRLVLMEPGLPLGKIAILVGGPDWPTSVLCGILGLRLLPILLGTLPVFLLILPTVLGGAFLSVNESYARVASVISVAAAAAVQSGSLVVAAVELDKQMALRRDDLDKLPLDEGVKRADDADAARTQRLRENTTWPHVPTTWRLALVLATALMTASSYLCTYWSSDCFREMQINDSVSKRLDGSWQRILKPPGVVALALFAASCCLHGAFQILWFRHQTQPRADDDGDDDDA